MYNQHRSLKDCKSYKNYWHYKKNSADMLKQSGPGIFWKYPYIMLKYSKKCRILKLGKTT